MRTHWYLINEAPIRFAGLWLENIWVRCPHTQVSSWLLKYNSWAYHIEIRIRVAVASVTFWCLDRYRWHALSWKKDMDGYVFHDDVIEWIFFPRYWPFVRGIHRFPVNSTHKGQWRWAVFFSLICARINGWVNTREAGDKRRHRAHYGVTVMHRFVCGILLHIHVTLSTAVSKTCLKFSHMN